MHSYRNKTTLPFTSKQLFEVVIDVESYPIFLPWCTACKIVNKYSNYDFDADLTVGYKAIDEKYTSKIKADYPITINSKAISGPFKYLDSTWTFKDTSDGQCEVYFGIEYKFKSFFLDKIMGGLFKKATIKMLDAFEKRAKDLYG